MATKKKDITPADVDYMDTYKAGKPDFRTLLYPEDLALESIVTNLGSEKYGPGDYMSRFELDFTGQLTAMLQAIGRHNIARYRGEVFDDESEVDHALHIDLNLRMILRSLEAGLVSGGRR